MTIKGSTILVTGGAGFIGSHIVESLVHQGARVIVYDNLSTGRKENLEHVKKDIKFIRGDILDAKKMRSAMKGVDIVSHQAAQLEIFRSSDDPEFDLKVNTIGTLNVLKAARANGVQKVINASSACIYGQVSGFTSEKHYPRPNWAYGVSKFAAEKYCDVYNDYYGLPVVSLRYGITFGEREWFRRVLTIFIKRALLSDPIVVFGVGNQVRDFIYVGDVVSFHNLCIESDKANGNAYNVGTGKATSIHKLARIVNSVSEKKLKIVFENTKEGEFSKLVPDKKRNMNELKVMLLDCKKAKSELGWKPHTILKEGIKREMMWASQNLKRWDKVFYSKI